MSVKLTRSLVCEVRWPKMVAKAPPLPASRIIAQTEEELDQKMEEHIELVARVFRKKSDAIAARAAGKIRKNYEEAKAAMNAAED